MPGRKNTSGKLNQKGKGSKAANFETNTSTQDLVLAESAFLVQDEKDKEITRLRVEVEALRSGQKHLASKKASISNALVAAVDKAKEIENSSKKVYRTVNGWN